MKTKLLKRLRKEACEQIYIVQWGEHRYDIMDDDVNDWWFDFSMSVETANTLPKAIAIAEKLQRERVTVLFNNYKCEHTKTPKSVRIDYNPWKRVK